ncbi:hypothetical protein ACIBKX_24885 [Streptomyces sp. NPDC050658]|uniref:hypothetical protein n=1 Tax=unclassified Streptomyces TaxID=2593676 RepID=UPI003429B425
MTRTTPPRPVDVAAVFPQLAPLARTATRLHPRAGSPSPHESSVGGPLLWPADEPWPYCDGPHVPDGVNPATSPEDVRLWRHIQAEAAGRTEGDPQFTREEMAIDKRIDVGCPWPEGPLAMLPVAQLYVRDVPLLRPPEQADLLQVLWCPFDHPPMPQPRTALFWRSAAEVTDLLTAPPEPAAVQSGDYVPQPCLLSPEQITEYPHHLELSEALQKRLRDPRSWESAGIEWDSSSEHTPKAFYRDTLSISPGWKTGGWTQWGLTDPDPQFCPVCDTQMDPLLTIASAEWSDDTRSWVPHEDQAHITPYVDGLDPANPPLVELRGGYVLQLYTCPEVPDHAYTGLIQ